MKTIHRYTLMAENVQPVDMPAGAMVLCVQLLHDVPCVWAFVDTCRPMETRQFRIVSTGQEMNETGTYIGTFQICGGMLVYHLFEIGD